MSFRRILTCLCITALMAASFALSARSEGTALFTAYDEASGKWGYIDLNGQWAIAPQFGHAGFFRGRYAAASTGDRWDDTEGIIDPSGNWVVEPRYFFDEGYDGWTYGGLNEGMWQVWINHENVDGPRFGFFDVPSGYFSGIAFVGELRWFTQEKLVPADGAYYDRTNGQKAFELPEGYSTDWPLQDSVFHDGFAPIINDNSKATENSFCFVDIQGNIIEPDHLQFGMDDWACGLLCASETQGSQDEPPIVGYYDLNTLDWRITSCVTPDGKEHRFTEAEPFSGNGYACVLLDNGIYGHIDTAGHLLFGNGCVTYENASGTVTVQITQPYRFYGDYAWIKEADVLIDPNGQTVLVIPEGWEPAVQWDDELEATRDYYVSPGGVIEVNQRVQGGYYRSALMKLNGEWLLDPDIYSRSWGEGFAPEWFRFFSEGLQPVRKAASSGEKQGKIGYVNEQGETVIDFLYDDGGVFLNGLAMVKRGDQTGYVNKKGKEVFFWTAP